ncbi:MAG: hypothetical protein J6M39_06825 [Lachnospiraceae bacterium]|nr:hypothetical protein [Lachnospiraceae bacterium]
MFGQINDTISLRGFGDSLVVVDIATIREANIKLLERNLFKTVVAQQDTIILNQYDIIEKYKQENVYLVKTNTDLEKEYKNTIELNKQLNKNLKYNKIIAYTLGGVSIATITYIIINSIANGK